MKNNALYWHITAVKYLYESYSKGP